MLPTVILLLSLTAVRIGLSTAEKTAGESAARVRAVGETLEILIIAICAVFLVIRPFVAQAFYIPSLSMAPTLQVNDRLIVNKLVYRFGTPQRNDIVVFRAPAKATGDPEEGNETDFVKRVVGIPGDVIEVHGGVTIVNGDPVKETWLKEPSDYDLPPFVVPPGRLFVLGDNRNHSNDSHRWGALESDHVIGKATFVFWPPSRIGSIR